MSYYFEQAMYCQCNGWTALFLFNQEINIMLTISYTRDQMIKEINNWLTGIAQSIDGSIEGDYEVIRNWKDNNGNIRPLIISGNTIIQGYNNFDTSIAPDWILRQEGYGNSTLVERLFCYIKGI